jgi:hypothetical protein
VITINLDERTDKAWRLYRSERGLTLFPSVWRTTGCRSHFIVWDDTIFWMDGYDRARAISQHEIELEGAVYNRLHENEFIGFVELADSLKEIPWTVLEACRRLVRANKALEAGDPRKGAFCRAKLPKEES